MERAEEILMEYLKGEKGHGYTARYAIIAAMQEYTNEIMKKYTEYILNNKFQIIETAKGSRFRSISTYKIYTSEEFIEQYIKSIQSKE